MDENESKWHEMKAVRERDRKEREKEEEWASKGREERIKLLAEEEKQRKIMLKNNKELRRHRDLREAGKSGATQEMRTREKQREAEKRNHN